METTLPQKIPKYFCEKCDIKTNNKKDYQQHLLTSKHIKLTNGPQHDTMVTNTGFICNICSKSYKSRTGLWKHKKTCKSEGNGDTLLNDRELVMGLVKQNAELMELLKSVL